MANRAVRRESETLDPMFFIPEGVDEFSYEEENVTSDENFIVDEEIDPEFVVVFDDSSEDEEFFDESSNDNTPTTPQVIAIAPPQLFRMGDSGAEVVDVILDVEDIAGVTKYEFRVTKL